MGAALDRWFYTLLAEGTTVHISLQMSRLYQDYLVLHPHLQGTRVNK